jgi:hypothetical protein
LPTDVEVTERLWVADIARAPTFGYVRLDMRTGSPGLLVPIGPEAAIGEAEIASEDRQRFNAVFDSGADFICQAGRYLTSSCAWRQR